MESTKTLDDKAIDAAIREWMASDDRSADGFRWRMRAAIAAALSAQGEAAQPAAEGFVLVPREPTEAMLRDMAAASRDFMSESAPYPRSKAVYRAMLSAVATSPNAASQDGGRDQ